MFNKRIIVVAIAFVAGGIFLFIPPPAGLANFCLAAENEQVDFKVYSDQLKLEKDLDLIPDDFQGSARMKLIDLGGDGQKEVVVSYGNFENPMIKLFRLDGSLINVWKPYVEGFTGEISIAVADLDNDGKEEIIAGPGAGGGPQVRVFNGYGAPLFTFGFWAHDQDYRNGVEVAAGDIDGDGFKEIIVSVIKDDKALVKFFNRFGEQLGVPIEIELENNFEPVKISSIDIDNDGVDEIIVGMGSGNQPKVKIFKKDGTVLEEFFAYGENFEGGVNFSIVNVDSNNIIVTGAGFSGGPHVRFFNSNGDPLKKSNFFSYTESFRGGVNVDYADIDNDGELELVTLPQIINNISGKYLHKYIDIDISEQKLRYYQNGKQVDEFIISSGKVNMPTPLGEYKIFQKNPRAYSSTYGLYMPWWMSFKPKYGLHELPEWPNGYKEGQDHLGMRVSHGCVRLGVGPAESLYNWTPIGTAVIIHE
ncbi:L,D-transpeptidase family protein [Candidatus Kuenenbacteria bacterium]|nr:L,D-transpeptidase family protein [Candidatus Kuenenbacteria bacterium]